MATEIRGTTDEKTRMMLGQIRKVFDPCWIQGFDNGRFLVSFNDDSDSLNELKAFADMYGYEMWDEDDDAGWRDYTFVSKD